MRALLIIMALTLSQIWEERIACAELARHDLIEFARLNTPAPSDRLNSRLSRYAWVRHHRVIADALQQVAEGKIKRLEIELPPRHGKSELSVRQFVPWFMGQYPFKSVIVLCHTDTLANSHGRDVRDYWEGPGFKAAFGHKPETVLRDDSRASDRLQSVAGGIVTFSGRSGLGAGVGGHLLIVDDIFKNTEEAFSTTIRDAAWRGYNNDAKTRLNDDSCPIIMIGSRRNEDDVQGRIFDPTNKEHYDAAEAALWTRIRIPALSEGPGDPMGRPAGEPIWPEKFGKVYFNGRKNNASEIVRDDHQTQDQCNPRPQEGTWFKKTWLKTYKAADLPKNLRIYVSSDHAIRLKEKDDSSCLLSAGIDPTGEVYILPNTVWKKLAPDHLVDSMFALARQQEIAMWWAARDAISGSLEPFIRKRMNDERLYFPLDDSITESKDLVQRSSSIRGLMAMGKVHWPIEWPLWPQAENQLLSFPGKHDDLVAALAILGMGMDRMDKAAGPNKQNIPPRGSFDWHRFGQDKDKGKNTWA